MEFLKFDLQPNQEKWAAVIVAATFLSCYTASAEVTTGTTTPVGYVKMGSLPTSEGVQANSDAYMATPLLKRALLKGKVSAVTGSTISISDATAALNLVGPHYFIIESGSKNGLIALITSSTVSSVTVALQPGETFTDIAVGDKISLTPAWTLGSLFEETLPTGTRIAMWSNSHDIGDPPPDQIYQFNGSDWMSVDNSVVSNDVVLFPGETFIVRTSSVSVPKLTIVGEASLIKSRNVLLGTPPGYNTRAQWVHYFTSTKEPIINSGIASVDPAQGSDGFSLYYNYTAEQNRTATFYFYLWGGYTYSMTDSLGNWYPEDIFVVDSNFFFDPAVSGMKYMRGYLDSSGSSWTDLPEYLPIH